MSRIHVSSGAPWEATVGYSRAVRVGDLVLVSGTTATDADGEVVGHGDAYAQTVQTLCNIQRALEAVDSRLEDVVRTRIYLKTIGDWEQVGRAHGEFFGEIRPACTLLQVAGLISGTMLVEIEAEALVGSGADDHQTVLTRGNAS